VNRQLLFVQGGGARVHDDWDAKLVASLERELGLNYEIRYPRMPDEDDPRYVQWKQALEKELAALHDRAILIGHSIGGTVLASTLAEQSPQGNFGALFLIAAPFVGDGGWPSDDLESLHDLGAKLPREMPVHIYHGLADEIAPASHADLYARAVPQARVHHLPGCDYQLNNDLREVAAAIKSLDSIA
jgi:predicted alpha/beta hydrolase family esterase